MDEYQCRKSQKLVVPQISGEIMERSRLIESFTGSKAGIAYITASAGFGKTVLLVQLAGAIKKPVIWYHLDPYDNDPTLFLRYLVAGCQKHYADFGKDILSYIDKTAQTNSYQHRTLLSLFMQGLEKFEQGVTLVFDDCHAISEPMLIQFMESILCNIQPIVKILIAGRTDVFQLHRLLVKGAALNFNAADLYFTQPEIAHIFSRHGYELGVEDLERVENITGGWPLAVSLFAVSSNNNRFDCGKKNRDMLFHYMAAEILAGENKDVRLFLEAIAVLEEITPQYCNMLLHRSDAGKLLSTLKSKYFFLVPLADTQGFYRYHPLFREYLLEQLGDAKFALLERAGDIACQVGEPEKSVEYYISAGRLEKAEAVVIKEGKRLMGKGNWHTVERWLHSLTTLEKLNPWLILYKAQIELNFGRIFSGENLVNQALKSFAGTNDLLGMAESSLLKAKMMRCQGRYQESLSLLETAIPDLTGNEADEWFDPLLELSYTLIMCGRFREAEEVLNSALTRAEQQGDPVLITYFCEGLGNLYFAWGYPDRSLYYFRRGMAISPDKMLRNYYFQDAVGPIYQDWGNLDRALEYLQQSVIAKENFGPYESLPSAYLQLGDVLLDRGDVLQAEGYYRKGLEIMESRGGDHFVLVLTHLSLAVCLGVQGRVVEAEAAVERARNESTGQSGYITACFQMVEALFFLQKGDPEAAYPLLQNLVQILEPLGARKPLCVTYASLALIGIIRRNEKETAAYAGIALKLAAEMNYVHDFLISYEVFKPLLYHGLERGLSVQFLQRVMVMLGEPAVPLLQMLASHTESAVRARALAPLAQIGSPGALETLKTLLEDEKLNISVPTRKYLFRSYGGSASAGYSVDKEAKIRLELLGPVRIYDGKKEITNTNWVRKKSRDLLIYLAHLGISAEKDRIIEALWPETDYQQANAIFHTTLHNLRRVLAIQSGRTDLIQFTGGGYLFSPESFLIDKVYFQQMLSVVGHDNSFREENVSLMEGAVALYRGDYLEGMDYSWVLPEQEYLRQLHNRARDSLSLYYLNRHDNMQAIVHLERLVQDNPLTEEYYHRLLTAYAEIGDIQSINLKYHRMESVFREELGISPSKKIQESYRRLIGAHH